MVAIGRKLKELRKNAKLTQEDFAKEIGVGRVNYTRYETDVVRPDYDTLIKIADFYGVTLDEIFEREV